VPDTSAKSVSVKHSPKAIGSLYDSHRDSWIDCYPNTAFIEDSVDERRGRMHRETGHLQGITQLEIDITVGLLVLIQLSAIVYISLGLHLY
jgi:hypothetical protein